jgi:5,10-methylenetetrahydrofolate reductase
VNDTEILRHIGELVDEEHALERAAAGLSDDEATRLKDIEVALDQCWDLLRQRRARREAGENPEDAAPRSESVVEGYQQ